MLARLLQASVWMRVFGCECLDATYFHCGAQGSAEVYAEETLRDVQRITLCF